MGRSISATTSGPCGCCGGSAFPVCSCALLIPPLGASPYSDLATAQDAIAHMTYGCFCHAYIASVAPNNDGVSAAFDFSTPNVFQSVFTIGPHDSDGSYSTTLFQLFSVNLKAGSTLTIDYVIDTIPGLETVGDFVPMAELFNCEGSGGALFEADNAGHTSGTLVLGPVPSSGEYILRLRCFYAISTVPSPTTTTQTWTVSADDSMTVNPVVAQWDDSGTTRQLEACPKFIIPFGGGFYSDQTTAQFILDNFSAGCICVFTYGDSIDSFSATDGGSTLTFAGKAESSSTLVELDALGCINLIGGDTVSVAWALTPTGTFTSLETQINLLDASNVAVDSSGSLIGASGTRNVVVPYSGKFYVEVLMLGFFSTGSAAIEMSAVISSSGLFSANRIKALYDAGLACPSGLECDEDELP